jgi:hypothetical protein
MRFILKQFVSGDTKRVTRFLWWPVTINGETRWLERVTVEYTYGCYKLWAGWIATQFVD